MKQLEVLIYTSLFFVISASRVLELSDRFLEIRKDGLWLVMFYAPWCAHCKRLEPIWSHVAQTLHNTNIRVGRVDCTRFTNVANEFHIAGFPTILFLKGESAFTYKGDRSKEEIVNFALRMSGPPVQQITRAESLETVKQSNPLLFVYIGEQDGPLWETYRSAAEEFQPHSFFYTVAHNVAIKHMEIESCPSIFVYKESTHYFFQVPEAEGSAEEDLNGTLFDWVNKERFHTFMKVTRGNFHQLLRTGKFLVLAVVEENKLQEIPTEMLEFRDMVETVIRRNRDRYHNKFQFGWIGTPDLANSVAMSVLSLPNLLVVNSTTNHHHLPEDDISQLTPEALAIFLDQVLNQSAPVYGGDTFVVRLYRTYFEARTSLAEMWYGNPVLTAVLFGLPLGFLSLICYSICCADIMDADEDDEDTAHEKKE